MIVYIWDVSQGYSNGRIVLMCHINWFTLSLLKVVSYFLCTNRFKEQPKSSSLQEESQYQVQDKSTSNQLNATHKTKSLSTIELYRADKCKASRNSSIDEVEVYDSYYTQKDQLLRDRTFSAESYNSNSKFLFFSNWI